MRPVSGYASDTSKEKEMSPSPITIGCILAVLLGEMRILWQLLLNRPPFVVEYQSRKRAVLKARRTMVERICNAPQLEQNDATRKRVVDVVLAHWLHEVIPPFQRWGWEIRFFLILEFINVASLAISVTILLAYLALLPFMSESGSAAAGSCAAALFSTVFVLMVVTLLSGFRCVKLHEKRTSDIGA